MCIVGSAIEIAIKIVRYETCLKFFRKNKTQIDENGLIFWLNFIMSGAVRFGVLCLDPECREKAGMVSKVFIEKKLKFSEEAAGGRWCQLRAGEAGEEGKQTRRVRGAERWRTLAHWKLCTWKKTQVTINTEAQNTTDCIGIIGGRRLLCGGITRRVPGAPC